MRCGGKKFDFLVTGVLGAHADEVVVETAPTDADLVMEARRGDAAALGLVLERSRAGMRAIAVSLLGWGPDADDVVQDAMLIALRRIGELRDPTALGPWLHTITRNIARMRLRSVHQEFQLEGMESTASHDPRPDQVLDEHALRDWLWSAMETLSEPLQTVVLLRYFSQVTSYQQIAAACDIPVGTVRSRLNEARRKLTAALAEVADAAHIDSDALLDRRRRTAQHWFAAAATGGFAQALEETASPDLDLVGPQGQRARGRGALIEIMENDLEAGVRQRINQVTASTHLTLLECDLLSPPWNSAHCPPGVLWLMRADHERVESIRLFHPKPARPLPNRETADVWARQARPGADREDRSEAYHGQDDAVATGEPRHSEPK